MKSFHPLTFLDCGAPTLYNEYARKNKTNGYRVGSLFRDRAKDSKEYVQTQFFQDYLNSYIQFCKELPQKNSLTIASLDVINNPETTLEIWLRMKNEGIDAIPTWHLGEDESFLDDYVNKYKVPFLALGGIAPNPPSALYGPMKRIWNKYLLNKDGTPRLKVHGFALTSFSLMFRYPFYSVDSTRANMAGRFGTVMVPARNHIEKNPLCVPVSFKKEAIMKKDHFAHCSKKEQQVVLHWIKKLGFEFGENELVEEEADYLYDNKNKIQYVKILKPGVSNSATERIDYCMSYLKYIELNVPKCPVIFHSGGYRESTIDRFFNHHRLLSFYQVRNKTADREELFRRLNELED